MSRWPSSPTISRCTCEKIFGPTGLAVPGSTLALWVGQTGVQLQLLVDALHDAVLAQPVIHGDETSVQMPALGEKTIEVMRGPMAALLA